MADLGVEEDEDEEDEEERLIQLSARLPRHMKVREARGEQTPCTHCGRNEWRPGDFYVYDDTNPGDKYCVPCAEEVLAYDSDAYCCEGCNNVFDLLELNDDMLCADCAPPDDESDERRDGPNDAPNDEPPKQRQRTQ